MEKVTTNSSLESTANKPLVISDKLLWCQMPMLKRGNKSSSVSGILTDVKLFVNKHLPRARIAACLLSIGVVFKILVVVSCPYLAAVGVGLLVGACCYRYCFTSGKILEKENVGSETIQNTNLEKVNSMFCMYYNFCHEGLSTIEIPSRENGVPLRSFEVMCKQIEQITDPNKKKCVCMWLFKGLSETTELLPYAKKLKQRSEFSDYFSKNIVKVGKPASVEAQIGVINTYKNDKNVRSRRVAYVYGFPTKENEQFLAMLNDVSKRLRDYDIVSVWQTMLSGESPGKALELDDPLNVVSLHYKLKNIKYNGSVCEDKNVARLKSEFDNFLSDKSNLKGMKRLDIKLEEASHKSFVMNLWSGYASAYRSIDDLEKMHEDDLDGSAVSISSVTSNSKGAGVKFREFSDGVDQAVSNNGRAVIFPSDACHGSDLTQLWTPDDLARYEGLIDELDVASNAVDESAGNLDVKQKIETRNNIIRQIRVINAGRVNRIITKKQFYLTCIDVRTNERVNVGHQLRGEILAKFHNWNDKNSS